MQTELLDQRRIPHSRTKFAKAIFKALDFFQPARSLSTSGYKTSVAYGRVRPDGRGPTTKHLLSTQLRELPETPVRGSAVLARYTLPRNTFLQDLSRSRSNVVECDEGGSFSPDLGRPFRPTRSGMKGVCPENVVLLAAGRGQRLAPLTDAVHKSLLPIAGRPVLGYVVDQILAAGSRDVVCVTGYKSQDVQSFLKPYGDRVRFVHNERFAEDFNILSVELGVNSLRQPRIGYTILETDIVVDERGWETILADAEGRSYWVTKGRYGTSLTGGCLNEEGGCVKTLTYAPNYNPRYKNWRKLLGALIVGPGQVDADRRHRRQAISSNIAQYYMTPWVKHLPDLPCGVRDLGDAFAHSFNDFEAYEQICQEFSIGKVHD